MLPLGTLAGQIGVSTAASDGQLVVRLTTPRRGDYYAPAPRQDYTLAGQLTTDRGDTALEFFGCGDACFVSTVDWPDGDTILTLRADAPTWRGGTTSLLVPWPTQPGADDLARAVTAMRQAEHVLVYESVTSDTTTGVPNPQQLDLTGAFFVSQEPYASGVAPIAARISRPGQPIRLAPRLPRRGNQRPTHPRRAGADHRGNPHRRDPPRPPPVRLPRRLTHPGRAGYASTVGGSSSGERSNGRG